MSATGSLHAEASDFVRDGRAFEAGKMGFIVRTASALSPLTLDDEWSAFLAWAEQFDGFVPQALRLTGNWCAGERMQLTAVSRAWMAFRQGWLLTKTHSEAQ